MTEKTNAVEIHELLKEILGRDVHPGVRYNAMKRLEEDEMLVIGREIMERIDTRMRISYQLSEKGLKQFNTEQAARERLQKIGKKRYKKQIF